MAISIEKVVFNPFVLGLIGFALLSLSMKLNSKKILNLKLNPLAYVGFLLCLYFLLGVTVVFTSDIYWLLLSKTETYSAAFGRLFCCLKNTVMENT